MLHAKAGTCLAKAVTCFAKVSRTMQRLSRAFRRLSHALQRLTRAMQRLSRAMQRLSRALQRLSRAFQTHMSKLTCDSLSPHIRKPTSSHADARLCLSTGRTLAANTAVPPLLSWHLSLAVLTNQRIADAPSPSSTRSRSLTNIQYPTTAPHGQRGCCCCCCCRSHCRGPRRAAHRHRLQ